MLNDFSLAKAYKKCGFSYLGSVTSSAKIRMSYEHNVATYCIYLAPSTMSGYQVCANDKHCKAFCLNESGQNKADVLARGKNGSVINQSRIKKAKLFYENRELFMRIMITEIIKAQKKAKENGMEFAVRINGTSDLSPLIFTYNGYNILELFPHVQFYDYTKVYNRINVMKTYKNYDVTLSYNGHNWNECEEFLNNDGKVFASHTLPKKFHGFDVIDANHYDMRYLDPKKTIMGLTYHRVANDYSSGKFVAPNTPFIIKEDDVNCEY